MTVKEIETLLGVKNSTLYDWKKPENGKHALYKLLKALELDEAKKLLKE